MKFQVLAFRNLASNWHRYSAYFLSCVFSVAVFFVYAAYTTHPQIVEVQDFFTDWGEGIIRICAFLIFSFSFFFVLYSSSIFIESRKKEIGLFSLFGMSKWQVRRMLLYENLIIALLSIAVGIGAGTVLLKLFLLTMSYYLLLEVPLPFFFPINAAMYTFMAYMTLFSLISLWTLRKIGNAEIVDLIRTRHTTEKKLRFSWILGLFAIACLTWGYSTAWSAGVGDIAYKAFPILISTIVGTYFLYTQFSVLCIKLLSLNRSWYYRGTNLLNISRAAYRIKDNARVLFTISILVAVVLTSSAAVYALDRAVNDNIKISHPFAFSMLQMIDEPYKLQVDEIIATAKKFNHQVTAVESIQMIRAQTNSIHERRTGLALIRQSDLIRLEKALGYKKHAKTDSEVYWVNQNSTELFHEKYTDNDVRVIQAKLSGQKDPITFHVKEKIDQTILLIRYSESDLLALPDSVWEQIYKKAKPEDISEVTMIDWMEWERSFPLVKALNQLSTEPNSYYFTTRIGDMYEVQQTSSLAFFIGIFISILFFIASGSVIYFKLFNDLQEDRVYYQSLVRIGLSDKEIRRVVTGQVGLIFFLPCLIGSLHTIFAMKSLSNLFYFNTLEYGYVIVIVFILMQALYFMGTRRTYMRIIMRGIVR